MTYSKFKKTQPILLLLFFFSWSLSYAQLVNNIAELENAISQASPGSTITLADGTWKDTYININKDGTLSDPITIKAQNAGAVLMTGNSRVYMRGSYLILTGLVFQDPSELVTSGDNIKSVIELKECDYCNVINNKIDSYNGTESQKSMTYKWILSDGQHIEIAYNSFIGKYGVGSIINDNRNSSDPDYLRVHHNYFADRTPINGVNDDNDQDAIRIGNSGTSLQSSFTEVYENYFYNFFGEIEVISNKSGENKYYNNTFRKYSGALTLRHGNNCEVHSNYFFAEDNLYSGGVRIIGEGHRVYNNYIEGINSTKTDGSTSNATGGINVSNGRPNTEINGYYQVKNTEILNNTFVNCDYALRIGTKVKSDLSQAPENIRVANNIMYNTSKQAYQTITSPTGSSLSEGNILDLPNNALTFDGKFYRLQDGSDPIGVAVGNYEYLSKDILGADRKLTYDAGAEEFAGNGSKFPFDESDVGVTIGFGAISEPTLSTVPITLIFDENANTKSFDIISNVDWTLLEDIPWLTVEKDSGMGSTTVDATVTKNATGLERSGSVIIKETSPNGLETELTIVQLNTFLPAEIPIIGATSLGMEDKEGIDEINAYNDDLSNYWTGDPDSEDEVSITFDLECVHELTEIGIHFWKADERTTTFSIAISDEALGPFTTIIDEATSAESGVTVDSEQLFDIAGTTARFVKFIGIGNSSDSNWTSIANVNIYGNFNCEGISSIEAPSSESLQVNLYPVPVQNGILTILSESQKLGPIEFYDNTGNRILQLNGHGRNTLEVDLSDLNPGIYFVRLKGLGVMRFTKI